MPIRRAISLLRRGSDPAARRCVEVAWDVGRAPVVLHVRHGARVRLVFRRRSSEWGSDAVCFPDLGMIVSLAPFGPTPVDVAPPAAGVYRFHAPHGDLEGRLVVRS